MMMMVCKNAVRSISYHRKDLPFCTLTVYPPKFYRSFPTRTSNAPKSGDLLVLSPSLWPEPNSSAAGVRTTSLMEFFASDKQDIFRKVHYGSGAKMKSSSPTINGNIKMHKVNPNRGQEIKEFLKSRNMNNLKAVIFDRFFAEEAYSFHFYKHTPHVLRILDMQDMHSLRMHRKLIVERNDKLAHPFQLTKSLMEEIKNKIPLIDNNESFQKSTTLLIRELASIHRSDLVLVCSPYELRLLRDHYGIPSNKLALAPFFTKLKKHSDVDLIGNESSTSLPFEARNNFVTIGGFKHEPNIDQTLLLKNEIWPKIREALPEAKLKVYGAYPPLRIQQLHDVKTGFLVKGHVDNLDTVFKNSRILLAPLRFGAGIKGKIVDAWRYGCPVVTTPIGAEGIYPTEEGFWGGFVEYDSTDFIKSSIDLYSNKQDWTKYSVEAEALLKHSFDADKNFRQLCHELHKAWEQRDQKRKRDFTSAIIWHDSNRCTEYFSKWIEQKEMG